MSLLGVPELSAFPPVLSSSTTLPTGIRINPCATPLWSGPSGHLSDPTSNPLFERGTISSKSFGHLCEVQLQVRQGWLQSICVRSSMLHETCIGCSACPTTSQEVVSQGSSWSSVPFRWRRDQKICASRRSSICPVPGCHDNSCASHTHCRHSLKLIQMDARRAH